MLSAALTQPQLDLVAVEQGLDSRDGLFLQLAEMAGCADLVITTGGISVGEEDHVKRRCLPWAVNPFQRRCSQTRQAGVLWLRPGVLAGPAGQSFVCLRDLAAFRNGVGRQLTGEAGQTARRHVVTGAAISRKVGRRCELRPATCTGFDGHGREVVTFDAETHSAHVCALPDRDGLIFLPADCDFLPAGALVEFQPFCRT